MRRKHSDVVLAGLILVGATMWLGSLAHRTTEIGKYGLLVVWFVAAFAAAHIARRIVADLDFGETAIAAVVAMAIVMGIHGHHEGEPMRAEMLIPIAIAELGAIAGALTSRRKPTSAGNGWLVLGGGFAGFGAAVLAVGFTMLVTTGKAYYGIALIAGALLGCFLVGLFTAVRGRHCALGLAVAFCVLLANNGPKLSYLDGGLVGLGLGSVLGAIGGAIGGRIRDRRTPRSDLPAAQVR